jgi:hypothetical protein
MFLLNQFYKNRTDYNKIKFNLESIIKSQLKEIVEKKENHTKKEETQSAQNTSLNNNTPQKVKKQPLVTNEEAEKHLLKKVFNLDLNTIN